jgi:hypothetical protein
VHLASRGREDAGVQGNRGLGEIRAHSLGAACAKPVPADAFGCPILLQAPPLRC